MTVATARTAPLGPAGAKRGERHLFLLVSIFSSTVVASLLILKFAPAPFFWVLLTWGAVLFAAIFRVHGAWHRVILFSFGTVACLLAGAEAYFFYTYKHLPPVVSNGFWLQDDILGWAPAKGVQLHAVGASRAGLFHGPALVFDTTYTIDSNGLRVAAPWRKDDLAGTVLFFGCGNSFGEGLRDDETLPYQIGVQSGGRYRTFNFAFDGYSPAQMLAAIEHGMVRRLVDTTPRYAYYVAIPHHVWRVAGRVAWIEHEPRYVLDVEGTVHQAGFIDHPPLALRLGWRIEGQLNKSVMWHLLSMRDARITEDDIRLYFAEVRRSQELLTAQYPGIQFHVILWPGYPNEEQQRSAYEKLQDGFRRMGIPLDMVEDILPGYKSDPTKYTLSSTDTHPNALANHFLAEYVLSKIAPAGR